MGIKKKLAGVMGDPISHSLSPLLHNHWLKLHGIEGEYVAMHVTPEKLEQELRALPAKRFAGCNLTIPHKEAALAMVDEVSDIAQRIGAVNTVVVKSEKLIGTNSDGYGFIENLKQSLGELTPYLEHVSLLGAGGAAKAIAVALEEEGAKRMTITNRTAARVEGLVRELNNADVCAWEEKDALLSDVTLLVNTTSLGMQGQDALDIDLSSLPAYAAVTDIVYKPLMTPLLENAKARGNPIVTGLGMLAHQAVVGFESWFGARPIVDEQTLALLQEHA